MHMKSEDELAFLFYSSNRLSYLFFFLNFTIIKFKNTNKYEMIKFIP